MSIEVYNTWRAQKTNLRIKVTILYFYSIVTLLKNNMKTKNIPLFIALLVGSGSFSSCKEKENEDLTPSVNKNGSVETAVTVEHLDSINDVLVTKHAVWYKGSQVKSFEYRDTVPALGIEKTTAENSNGDTKSVQVKKDYEIFITVK